jgi:RNA polymerase sigma-70 factor, ECF subfamily
MGARRRARGPSGARRVRPRHPARRAPVRGAPELPREADYLAQETYPRALRTLPSFAGRSSGRTWLLSIARHTAADAVRAAMRRPRLSAIGDEDTLDARGPVRGGAQEAVLLQQLIAALDPERPPAGGDRRVRVVAQLLRHPEPLRVGRIGREVDRTVAHDQGPIGLPPEGD